jgi:hypothetical protein
VGARAAFEWEEVVPGEKEKAHRGIVIFSTCRLPLIHWMKRIGDDNAGFSADYDPELRAVRVRAWGFWSVAVALDFARTVSEVCRANPRGAALFMDMTDLKPLRDEGQRSFGILIGSLRDLGVGRTTVTTGSHLTRLQLLRLVAEHGAKENVTFAAPDEDLAGAP